MTLPNQLMQNWLKLCIREYIVINCNVWSISLFLRQGTVDSLWFKDYRRVTQQWSYVSVFSTSSAYVEHKRPMNWG